jgi:hypothetical protein
MLEGMGEVVEHLSSMREAIDSILSNAKKKSDTSC